MHILLTRPLEDSKELILRFSSLGHKVSHLPVIKVEPIEYDFDLDTYDCSILSTPPYTNEAWCVEMLSLIHI